MFKIGDLVTPKPAYINDGKVFEIVGIDYMKNTNTYELRPWEALPDEGICEGWTEDFLYLVRTIESIETEVGKRLVRTISEIIEETVKNFHLNKIGWDWKERDLTRKVVLSSSGSTWFNAKNIDKEEKDMSKILEMYKDKKEKEIREKFSNEVEAITKLDPIQSFMKEMNEQLETLITNEYPNDYITPLTCDVLTKNTENVKKELRKLRDKDIEDLNNKIKEIEALLELAPGYEEKIKILRDYEIIDKKKNIIL